MVAGILQPGYLPWLGFFEQLYRCDLFVIYDDVQYDKHGWRNRNRIKTAQGVRWLTVPVLLNFREQPRICDVRIDNSSPWRKKHFETIRQSYARARFFREYIGLFEDVLARDWEFLADLDICLIEKIADALGIPPKRIIRSSSLGVTGGRTERLIGICTALGAQTFYEGASGVNYIDPDEFAGNGITVSFQQYRHPEYEQLHGDFVPYLSVIDLMFNCGEASLELLLTGRK